MHPVTAPSAAVQDTLLAVQDTLDHHLRVVKHALRFGADPVRLAELSMALHDAAAMVDDACTVLDEAPTDAIARESWDLAQSLVGRCVGCGADLDPLSRRRIWCSGHCSIRALIARGAIEAMLARDVAGHDEAIRLAMASRAVRDYEPSAGESWATIVAEVKERIRHNPPDRPCDDPILWPPVSSALDILARAWRQQAAERAIADPTMSPATDPD
jgi:hypothetical protein